MIQLRIQGTPLNAKEADLNDTAFELARNLAIKALLYYCKVRANQSATKEKLGLDVARAAFQTISKL